MEACESIDDVLCTRTSHSCSCSVFWRAESFTNCMMSWPTVTLLAVHQLASQLDIYQNLISRADLDLTLSEPFDLWPCQQVLLPPSQAWSGMAQYWLSIDWYWLTRRFIRRACYGPHTLHLPFTLPPVSHFLTTAEGKRFWSLPHSPLVLQGRRREVSLILLPLRRFILMCVRKVVLHSLRHPNYPKNH